MQQRWNIASCGGSGWLTVMSILTYGAIKNKSSTLPEETWQQYRHRSDGSTHLPGVISDLYISLLKMNAFSWLTTGFNSPLIHLQYVPESHRSLITYFPFKNTLSLSSVLLKCNGEQNLQSLSIWWWRENNFKGFATIYKPMLQEARALRGLRWDRPPNQSLPPGDSSHWCWWWLTVLQSFKWLSNTAIAHMTTCHRSLDLLN